MRFEMRWWDDWLNQDMLINQSCPGKRLLNDCRHSLCTYDVFVGVRMTSLPVFRQTFGYSTLGIT